MIGITQANSTSGTGQSTTTQPITASVDKNMFLQLLVAQLKNQDPMNPTDSMQFVQQLAQYQQLEQSVNTGQDISAIRQDMDSLAGSTSGTVSNS
ncbi:MAG TPA: flagellar hook capping FlgD N-terminal domain-containing protein [Candidatus Sulfopaludibacter sp.]|jgi:flagellar basal-body rod modification protein FlgD|nr:flagellar hook capping FlgD N-terminal domain-containing protein [Candidatus Sulfopaludibacter sp.]